MNFCSPRSRSSIFRSEEEKTSLAFKEAIRTNLLREGLEKKRVVVLIIDETQKMDYPFLELLRDFFNFGTNEYKLLQLVLLGQTEFLEKTKCTGR